MNDLIQLALAASRRHWFRRRAIYRPEQSITSDQLATVESLYQCRLPSQLRQWLAQVGCGSFDDDLRLLSPEVMAPLEIAGPLIGYIEIAIDQRGDYYAVSPCGQDPAIYRFSFNPLGVSRVAKDFAELVTNLITHGGKSVTGGEPITTLEPDQLWSATPCQPWPPHSSMTS